MTLLRNSETSKNLPTWALILIILLFLIAAIISIWGFWSAFKFQSDKKDRKVVWAQHFRKKPSFSLNEIFNYKKGIFALTFKGIDINDFFVPVYIFSTKSLGKDITKLVDQIQKDSNHQINKYMVMNVIEMNQIVFVKLEDEPTNTELNKWIKLIDSKDRGFN